MRHARPGNACEANSQQSDGHHLPHTVSCTALPPSLTILSLPNIFCSCVATSIVLSGELSSMITIS